MVPWSFFVLICVNSSIITSTKNGNSGFTILLQRLKLIILSFKNLLLKCLIIVSVLIYISFSSGKLNPYIGLQLKGI